MKTIIIFDIKFKTNTTKIENILNSYGLKKIQKTTYFGELEKIEIKEIKNEINKNIKRNESLIILPICETCYKNKETCGKKIKYNEEFYKIL